MSMRKGKRYELGGKSPDRRRRAGFSTLSLLTSHLLPLGVLRLAIAQIRPQKGAYEQNLCRMGALFREVGSWPEPPELVVAPEAALTGYFLEGGVRDLAVPAE